MDADDAGRARVFCIGLNKTGTTSLHHALTVLGFRSLHWGGPAIRTIVETALENGRPLLEDLDPTIDAFSDIEALSLNFALLDTQYPGSRFILTVRPLDDWIDSRRRHVETNLRRKAAGEYAGNFLTVDEAAWRTLWMGHVDRVREHFRARDDYLEIDIIADGGWPPLCALLDRRVPETAFPWVNRGASRETT